MAEVSSIVVAYPGVTTSSIMIVIVVLLVRRIENVSVGIRFRRR